MFFNYYLRLNSLADCSVKRHTERQIFALIELLLQFNLYLNRENNFYSFSTSISVGLRFIYLFRVACGSNTLRKLLEFIPAHFWFDVDRYFFLKNLSRGESF